MPCRNQTRAEDVCFRVLRLLEENPTASQGADVIVHLAANTGVAPSVEDPRADCQTNVIGTLNMLEAARHAQVGRFVFASSGAPLGVQTPPLHEEMAPHPASPYGASKLAGEGYCSAYFHSFGVETVALRFGNVYGEGSQTRDFIHIGDLIRAIHAAATRPGIGGDVFQIATSRETTVGELTEKLVAVLKEETGIEAQWINGASRTGDVARNFSDTTRARERLSLTVDVRPIRCSSFP